MKGKGNGSSDSPCLNSPECVYLGCLGCDAMPEKKTYTPDCASEIPILRLLPPLIARLAVEGHRG